jgi:hypothetical protein
MFIRFSRITDVWRHPRSRSEPNGQPPESSHLRQLRIKIFEAVPGRLASALKRTEGAEPCESAGVARTLSLSFSAQHSADLQGVIEDRGRPVKHVQRAQIILLSAERLPC